MTTKKRVKKPKNKVKQSNYQTINERNYKMKKFRILMGALALAVVALTIVSCKKQEITEESNSQMEVLERETCRGKGTQYNDSIVASHSIPSCITALIQDSSFEFWDFDNIIHNHEFDTAGYYTYIVPANCFTENNILCITVKNNEIALMFGMMFPTNFDYQTYYNQNLSAYVEILSYDYEETFYAGYLDVRYNTFLFTYVNPQLLDDEGKLPPLHHWRDMNLCEKILTGAETLWYAGFIVGGVLNPGLGFVMALAGEANSAAYDFMRRKACQ